ncbi:MAG TPA: energy-coupling factor ABC transporter ATP-binding protein [Bacteroidota bacterium]|nr:energy-coupling factor ABC transporter ATP-binding protein [Bacteroidota bacterium]
MNALQVRALDYAYPDGTPALHGVTFDVEDGECVGIIGPNGAGKSTLLLHLNGLLPENGRGNVLVFGKAVTRETLHEVHQAVGLLFQDPDDQLFCPTVYEDVAFGPQQFGMDRAALDGAVRDALRQVGLEGFEKRSPHHLSGGEKQRVCLAGILACNPRILVLDEPTSDLDPRGRRELARLIKTLPAARVIASHDLELVLELCSRVFLLDGGEVVASGATSEILSNEQLMLTHGLEKPHSLQHRHPHP